MWNEPMPKWRTARKQYQCQGDGCAKVIAPGERYLDRAIRHPTDSRLRYCQECAEPVIARANGYHMFRGRNDFPDRYHQRTSSAQWKILKRKVIEQRRNRCERCGQVSASLELHHVHYRSLGSEQPEDVELLCPACHTGPDEARVAKSRPKRDEPQEGLIVGIDGDQWGKFDPDTIYIPLQDGRYVPLKRKRKS
jgi:5-methylcytosine-specific restriction endonuclease McrA